MKLLTYAINKKELTGVLNRESALCIPFLRREWNTER